jgi:ribonuclease D
VARGEAQLVTTKEALDEAIAHVREAGVFAYDTEFIGEESYWPRICVVQIATTERVVLVDAVADIGRETGLAVLMGHSSTAKKKSKSACASVGGAAGHVGVA